ncbi:MAG: carbohydrate ABC transporter permease [Planctomycetota bacterium]|jgi:ABC-type sugar transport system permease subunit
MIVKEKRPWWKKPFAPVVVFLIPGVGLYTLFFVVPAAQAFFVSLTEWSGFSPDLEFIGFANFRELLRDGKFRWALLNNMIIMFAGGTGTFVFALLFAASLANRRFPGRRFFKTVLFAPYVVSVVGVALLWRFIYDGKWGLLNGFLTAVGGKLLGESPVKYAWLGQWHTAMPALIAVMIWGGIGFYMVLLMAGIDRIPDDLYEAARMDGASEVQNFVHITLPLLRDVLIVGISIYIIGSLKTFGLIWAMTKGMNSTHVMGTYMYEVAFDPGTKTWRMGYGTSMTVVLFFLVILLTFTFNKVARRTQVEY